MVMSWLRQQRRWGRPEGRKILGLFNQGNMLFEIDRKGSTEPSLAEMTVKALDFSARMRMDSS